MTTKLNHNRLINYASRTILQSNGLFQKGQSRTWIDDNGWFIIVVEIQPKGWDKGACLNVGIDYLWRNKEYVSLDYGHCQREFIAFKDREESFYNDMLIMASIAMEKVEGYRRFAELPYGKRKILGVNRFSSSAHELYNKMMICGLTEDGQAEEYYKKLLEMVHNSEDIWEKEYFKELTGEIAAAVQDTKLFREYIDKKIRTQREFWHSTSSMKKLSDNHKLH